jgi:lipopolysaccharide/colanic/teichoic acid biosynthesis glycosyltransferase
MDNKAETDIFSSRAYPATRVPAARSARESLAEVAMGTVHAPVVIQPSAMSMTQQIAEALYRAFEITATLVALAGLMPIIAIVALAVKLDSPGPVLFFQSRTCQSRRIPGAEAQRRRLIPPPGGFEPNELYWVPSFFRFVKFRTMYVDAPERFPELYDYVSYDPNAFHGYHVKTERDPRVTRLGRILRRITVDELPNFWCVLTGQMRLVGPRPEIPEVLRYHRAEEMYKFSVKPGITGLAQINGRGRLSWGEMIDWDLKYVRTRTIMLDLKIIWVTIWSVLAKRGAF